MRIVRIKTYSKKTSAELQLLLDQLTTTHREIRVSQLKRFLHDKNTCLMGLFDQTRLIGMATLLRFVSIGHDVGYLDAVVVDTAYRGQGLSKRLMEAVLTQAKKWHLHHIDLTSKPERIAANALYKKSGFIQRETNVYRLTL